MKTYQLDTPLIAPIHWNGLQREIEVQLDALLNYSQEWEVRVEPWKSWQWRAEPQGNIAWEPLSWFADETDTESYATTSILCPLLGEANATMWRLAINDRADEALFVSTEPKQRPVRSSELVLTIAVSLAVTIETASYVRNDYGLCGPYSEMTSREIVEMLRCSGVSDTLDGAVNKVVENIERAKQER